MMIKIQVCSPNVKYKIFMIMVKQYKEHTVHV